MRIIAGSARGKKLLSPQDRSIRPAIDRVRESIFAILDPVIEGARVLDLFAGTGSFGLEALSRGARQVTFVDSSLDALEIVEKNIKNLGFNRQTTVLCGDALVLPDIRDLEEGAFGVVFMDPPFSMFYEPQVTERVFARSTELIRTRATGEDSIIMLRLPAAYRDPLPFCNYDQRSYGESTVVLLEKRSLDPGLS